MSTVWDTPLHSSIPPQVHVIVATPVVASVVRITVSLPLLSGVTTEISFSPLAKRPRLVEKLMVIVAISRGENDRATELLYSLTGKSGQFVKPAELFPKRDIGFNPF